MITQENQRRKNISDFIFLHNLHSRIKETKERKW